HAERRRRVRTFLPAVPAHPAPAVLLLGAERMLDLRRAGTIRRDQAPCRRGVPRHRRRRVHRQPAATVTAARVTWAVAGIVGRRAWRESPAVRAIPLWPDPPARSDAMQPPASPAFPPPGASGLHPCQRRWRRRPDRRLSESRKMHSSRRRTDRSMPMSDTPSSLPKPKKSVALSGTAAGNTALCTVGRSGNDLHYRGYDIHDLATKSTFEEVAHLLVHGALPTASQLKAYKRKLRRLRG